MAKILQYNDDINNARLDVIETTIGTAPIMRLYSGSLPATLGDARTGTLLAEGTLPSNYMADAASHVKGILGTWTLIGTASGVAGYFDISDSGDTKPYVQGNVGLTGGTFALELDNTNVNVSQEVFIEEFDITSGNVG